MITNKITIAASDVQPGTSPMSLPQFFQMLSSQSWGGTPKSSIEKYVLIGFNRMFHHKPSIHRGPHFWKPPSSAASKGEGRQQEVTAPDAGAKNHLRWSSTIPCLGYQISAQL